jgi:uncharacterized protein YodC (DUF2158 family)
MPMELILNENKVSVFLTCQWFKKKSVLKLLDHTVYINQRLKPYKLSRNFVLFL